MMKIKNETRAEIGEFAKQVGKLLAASLANNFIMKQVVPRVQKVGGRVLEKMSDVQGRKNAEELTKLANQTDKASSHVSPVAPVAPVITPSPAPSVGSDGPVLAKFL